MRGCHQKLKNKNIKEVLDEDFKLQYTVLQYVMKEEGLANRRALVPPPRGISTKLVPPPVTDMTWALVGPNANIF